MEPAENLGANHTSLRDRVYNALVDRIVNHVYKPGDRLIVRELEEHLKVSATPIKETLVRLAEEGLVQHQPRRGVIVADLTEVAMIEKLEMRGLLESHAAGVGLKNSDKRRLARLSEIHEELWAKKGVVDTMDQEKEFHGLIVSMTDNSYLMEIYRKLSVHIHIARYRYTVGRYTEADNEQVRQEHKAIMTAFENRDVKRARRALCDHVINVARRSISDDNLIAGLEMKLLTEVDA